MKKIGHIICEGEGAEVFEDGSEFVCVSYGHVIDDDDEGPRKPRVVRYSSLSELEAELPPGVVYRSLGDNSLPQWVLDDIKENS